MLKGAIPWPSRPTFAGAADARGAALEATLGVRAAAFALPEVNAADNTDRNVDEEMQLKTHAQSANVDLLPTASLDCRTGI